MYSIIKRQDILIMKFIVCSIQSTRMLLWTDHLYIVEGSGDEGSEEGEGGGFGGGPKPMLPYSSMFVFGPTNP